MASHSDIPHHPSIRTVFLLLAAELLLTLLLQLPGVADFQKFGFYDEGAWLHLDQLYAGGAMPTVDVGYSYGMLPLMVSRLWFATLGRTPWAFIAFVTACNILAAWGVARILHETQATWWRIAAACALLPLGILPNAYSLMHPLEMMLIISALAQQVRGRYGWALAFATLAVLTKPSMAYVLGLLLLLLAGWLKKGWRVVLPPALTGTVVMVAAIAAVGLRPAYANILPLTGGRSYKQMNFGIFHAGRDFWWHGGSLGDLLYYYLFTPALFWIVATLMVWGLGWLALVRLWRRRAGDVGNRAIDALLVTVACLHAAFVFAFYAWSGSWTYYSYLLVIGLLVGLRGDPRRGLLIVFVVLAVLGSMGRFTDARYRWMGMVRSPEVAGLWVYPDVLAEARQVRALAQQRHPLYMVNGALPLIWPEAQTPPSWFISPGIPTEAEFKKTRQQIAGADLIILCLDYDQNQEAWKWPEFAHERGEFGLLLETKHFRVLARDPRAKP